MTTTPRPRLAFALLVAGLAFGAGCEEPDETVRGAGSIEVPVQNLGFQPADVPAPTPLLEEPFQGPNLDRPDDSAGTGRN